ncbi:MAG: PilN domain-containing protein [Candidatus Omnitrophica bacterium]|nr:PilN domain-containing protein [Candidatus Omnitrophota bacterium]
MLLKNKILTILSIRDDQITVVQGSESKLNFTNSVHVDWTDTQNVNDTFAKVFPSAYRRNIRDLCLILPRQMFFMKLIHLPSIDESELRKMTALQIVQHLPYPESQAVWDIVVCDRHGSTSDVIIFAVQSEVVMKYLRILSLTKIFPTVVTLSSCVLSEFISTTKASSHTVVFYPDVNASEICFCCNGQFYYSRAIANTNDFEKQVRLTFETQHKSFAQMGQPTAGVCLTSSLGNVPQGLLEKLSGESGIDWNELLVSKEDPIEKALLRKGFKGISNFLPRDLKDRYSNIKGRQNLITLFVLGVAAILSVTLAVSAPAIKKISQIRLLDQQLQKIEEPFLKSQEELKLRTTLQQRLDQRISPLALVQELYATAPQSISFSRIQVSNINTLNLEGQALQSTVVNELQEMMIANTLFGDVRLEHAVRRNTATGEVIHFAITAKLLSIRERR